MGSIEPPLVLPSWGSGIRYTIQEGDTLFAIAQKYGVDPRDILEANPSIVDPEHLMAGSVIFIPGGTAPEPPLPPEPAETVARNPGHPGPLPAEREFVWPLKGAILCRFGKPVPWRMRQQSWGLDVRAAPGQIVAAAKSGRVNTFDTVPGFGKVVILEHLDGTTTFYGHLHRILVTHGTWVKQSERIATAGSSGLSSGVELHFRIMRNSEYVDPLLLLPK